MSESPIFQTNSIVGDDLDFAEEESKCSVCDNYDSECECPLNEDERSYF